MRRVRALELPNQCALTHKLNHPWHCTSFFAKICKGLQVSSHVILQKDKDFRMDLCERF